MKESELMETMIVEISIPAINRTFDFQLPASGIVRDVIAEVTRIIGLSIVYIIKT